MRSGGPEVRRSGGPEVRRSGGPEVRRSGGPGSGVRGPGVRRSGVRVPAHWRTASVGDECHSWAFGDAAGFGWVIEREQAAVVEEQNAVGDVADTRELVGRDDDRHLARANIAFDPKARRAVSRVEAVVDQKQASVRELRGRKVV